MVRRTLTVALEADAYAALLTLAEHERRRPADEAAAVLRKVLIARSRRMAAGAATRLDRAVDELLDAAESLEA